MSTPPLPIILLVSLLWSFALRSLPGAPEALRLEVRRTAVTAYANMATDLTAAAAVAAGTLRGALEHLRDQPSEAKLKLARQAWIEARNAYLRTEPLRFGGGPIDDDDGPEQEVNPWPIDPAAVDQLLAILEEPPRLTKELLRQRHQAGGPEQATVGFQVMAYLLWKNEQAPGPRMAEYLMVCGAVMVENLQMVATEWRIDQVGNFRAMFLEEESLAVQRMITGLALLGGGELATMRLQLPLDAQSRLETTSPFSDSAQAEVGITIKALVEFGRALAALARAVDPAAAAVLMAQTKRIETLAEQLPKNFYEGGASAERITHPLILALEDQAASWRGIGKTQGLNIPLEVGPEGE